MYSFIGGAIAGTALYDLLGAAGLHWLAWPAVAVCLATAVAGTIIRRRLRRRS